METTLDTLIKAIQDGKINVVQKLIALNKNLVLEKYSKSVPFEDEEIGNDARELLGDNMTGMNAIHIGLMSLDIENENVKVEVRKKIIEELIQALPQKIDLSTYRWGNDNTTLHLASFLGERSIITKILKKGEDPSYKNGLGKTSIDVAVDYELADYLTEVSEELNEEKQEELRRKESLQNILKKCQNIEETIQHNKQEAEDKNKYETESQLKNNKQMIDMETELIKKVNTNEASEEEKEYVNDINNSNETIGNDETKNDEIETNINKLESENGSCNTINNNENSNENQNIIENNESSNEDQNIIENNENSNENQNIIENNESSNEDQNIIENNENSNENQNIIENDENSNKNENHDITENNENPDENQNITEDNDKNKIVEQKTNDAVSKKKISSEDRSKLSNLIDIDMINNLIGTQVMYVENNENKNMTVTTKKEIENIEEKKDTTKEIKSNIAKPTINKMENINDAKEETKINNINNGIKSLKNTEFISSKKNIFENATLNTETNKIKDYKLSPSTFNNVKEKFSKNDNTLKSSESTKESDSIKAEIMSQKNKSIKSIINNINKGNEINDKSIKKPIMIGTKDSIKNTITNINKNNCFDESGLQKKEKNATLVKDFNICQKENIKETISNINKNMTFNGEIAKPKMNETLEKDINICQKENIKTTISNINKNKNFTGNTNKSISSSTKIENDFQNFSKERDSIKATISNINKNNCFNNKKTSTEPLKEVKPIEIKNNYEDAENNPLSSSNKFNTPKEDIKEITLDNNKNIGLSKTSTSSIINKFKAPSDNEQQIVQDSLKTGKIDETLNDGTLPKKNNSSNINIVKKRDISKLIQTFNQTSENETQDNASLSLKEETTIQADKPTNLAFKSNISALKSTFDRSESKTEKLSVSSLCKNTNIKPIENRENEMSMVQKLSSKFISNENEIQTKKTIEETIENKEINMTTTTNSNITDKPQKKVEIEKKVEVTPEIVKGENILEAKEEKKTENLENPNNDICNEEQIIKDTIEKDITENNSKSSAIGDLSLNEHKDILNLSNEKESEMKKENKELSISNKEDTIDINKIINDASVSGSDLTLNDDMEETDKNSKKSKIETKSKIDDCLSSDLSLKLDSFSFDLPSIDPITLSLDEIFITQEINFDSMFNDLSSDSNIYDGILKETKINNNDLSSKLDHSDNTLCLDDDNKEEKIETYQSITKDIKSSIKNTNLINNKLPSEKAFNTPKIEPNNKQENKINEQKEKELREKKQKEKELKEREQKEKEQKEKELKEKEQKENELKEKEQKEKEQKEKELLEKEQKEKEQKEKEQKEKELLERKSLQKTLSIEKELKDINNDQQMETSPTNNENSEKTVDENMTEIKKDKHSNMVLKEKLYEEQKNQNKIGLINNVEMLNLTSSFKKTKSKQKAVQFKSSWSGELENTRRMSKDHTNYITTTKGNFLMKLNKIDIRSTCPVFFSGNFEADSMYIMFCEFKCDDEVYYTSKQYPIHSNNPQISLNEDVNIPITADQNILEINVMLIKKTPTMLPLQSPTKTSKHNNSSGMSTLTRTMTHSKKAVQNLMFWKKNKNMDGFSSVNSNHIQMNNGIMDYDDNSMKKNDLQFRSLSSTSSISKLFSGDGGSNTQINHRNRNYHPSIKTIFNNNNTGIPSPSNGLSRESTCDCISGSNSSLNSSYSTYSTMTTASSNTITSSSSSSDNVFVAGKITVDLQNLREQHMGELIDDFKWEIAPPKPLKNNSINSDLPPIGSVRIRKKVMKWDGLDAPLVILNGKLNMSVFYLPDFSFKEDMFIPKTIADCLDCEECKRWHDNETKTGYLTQKGGDVNEWERRFYRLIGEKLIAFDTVSSENKATIDLTQCKFINLLLPDPQNSQFINNTLPNGEEYTTIVALNPSSAASDNYIFELVFKDDDAIEFRCDSLNDMNDWCKELQIIVQEWEDFQYPNWWTELSNFKEEMENKN
ncbi:hypothetical protein BCR36DRAFT_410817 [Piromyces finnis]|uniref:PH domain-containing protein n=1 Tax=Piromyces finnis TaxID=1754191 RepID=A0A1Y1VEJ7_9FUNG|nr:hypothetical protein BCR36DRAFT_410817 [Piromyces finnis]|eukprot:ORX54275.1 hypothetical protein BCR36DRAFT_410817 [Piromyces finnis]